MAKIATKTKNIKLVKSLIGRKDSHIATANSLGLKKIGDETNQPDNEATKGKIKEISYLIEVSEA
jgi:large subunit ribosomal protein L30